MKIRFLLIISTLISLTTTALGAVFVTSTTGNYSSYYDYLSNSTVVTGSLPSMSSTDLLQTSVASTITGGSIGQETSGGLSALTDGIAGTQHSLLNSFGSNSFITYMLDLASNPQGYDISRIDIQTGWPDTGRVNLTTLVYISTIADPNSFNFLGSADLVYPGGSPLGPWIVASFSDNSTGVLASQVAGLRFTFPNQQNGYVGFGEIDVISVPEPSKTLFIGMVIMSALTTRRRGWV